MGACHPSRGMEIRTGEPLAACERTLSRIFVPRSRVAIGAGAGGRSQGGEDGPRNCRHPIERSVTHGMVVRGNLRRDALLCAAKREEMYFLAITRRRVERFTQAEFDARLGDEADCARALYAGGTFRAIHSRGDVPGAVIASKRKISGPRERPLRRFRSRSTK